MSEANAGCCTLTPDERRTRRSLVPAEILPHVVTVASLDDGVRLDFGPTEDLRGVVEDFVVLEKDCCNFLTFTISPPAEDLSLVIQGPPEATHVIEMFRKAAQGEDQ